MIRARSYSDLILPPYNRLLANGPGLRSSARIEFDGLSAPPQAPRFLLHDLDTKFTRGFDKIFETEGAQVIPLPFQAPRANAFAELWVGTARREVLDLHLIFGRRQLDHVLREFVDHYHLARPHQGLEQRSPVPQPASRAGPVVRRDRLGGLLHEYHRAAA